MDRLYQSPRTTLITIFPKEATPSERGILFAYYVGYHNVSEIAAILRPNSKPEVYRTLKKYKDLLPVLRSSVPAQQYHGVGYLFVR